MRTSPHTLTRAHRRGFTFLEAVLGAALLGLLAGAVFGVFGYAWSVELRARQTLGAAEVANRIMVSYLDDTTSIEKTPDTIQYQEMSFRWSLNAPRATIRDAHPDARVDRNGQPEIQEALDQMEAVTVTAWLDDGTPDGLLPGRTPTFSLDRVIDPLAFRGADSIERLIRDPDGGRIQDLLQRLLGLNDEGTP